MSEVFKKIAHFESEMFGELSIVSYGSNDEPWFLGSDVRRILGITEKEYRFYSRIPDELKRREKVELPVINQYGVNLGVRYVESVILSEAGLYVAIFSSRKPDARAFQIWVGKEVIPALRRYGMYVDPNLARELSECGGAQQFMEKYYEATNFYNGYCEIDSEGAVLIRDYVKLLNQSGFKIGQAKFFKFLTDGGYVCKSNSSRYFATKKYSDKGFFKTTLVSKLDKNGIAYKVPTGLRITQKGQAYFYKKLLEKKRKESPKPFTPSTVLLPPQPPYRGVGVEN